LYQPLYVNLEWKLMKKSVIGFFAVAMLSACAATDDKAAQVPREEKTVTTGSNIPKRDKADTANVQTVSPAALERAAGVGASAPAPGR
jgi:hypothetical protein